MPGLKVVDDGVDVGADSAQQLDQEPAGGPHGHHAAFGRRHLVDNGLGAGLLDGVEDAVGDVGQCFVPGDALPLAFAALAGPPQGIGDALFAVESATPGRPLLAAHGVPVRDAFGGRWHVAGDFFERDFAVLQEDVVHAAPWVAVDAVSAPGDAVPR